MLVTKLKWLAAALLAAGAIASRRWPLRVPTPSPGNPAAPLRPRARKSRSGPGPLGRHATRGSAAPCRGHGAVRGEVRQNNW